MDHYLLDLIGPRIPEFTSENLNSIKLCIYYIKYYFFHFIDSNLQLKCVANYVVKSKIGLEKVGVYFRKVIFLANMNL